MAITCTGCGSSDPAEAKFCIECGDSVSASCPSCGTAVVFWSTQARIDVARSAATLGLETRVDQLLTEAGARSMRAGLLLDGIAEIRDEDAAATGS